MALELPYVHVRLGSGKPRVESLSRPAPLTPEDLTTLLALDVETQPQQPPGDRVVPLSDGAWAVGRGGFGGVTWRILSAADASRVPHPAWLWRSSRWFDPAAPPRGPIPNALPLRAQLDPASRLGGGSERTAALLASTIASLRRGSAPVAVVIDPTIVADPAPAGRWFLLALITMLPPSIRERLTMSTFEGNPSPEEWDLVVTSQPPAGFLHRRPEDHPALGGDLPATFLLECLQDDNPELAEEAAGWSQAGSADPWAAAIRQRWGGRHTATPAGERRRHPRPTDPGAPPRRLRLNTPEAWLSLSHRSEEERGRIVAAWLDREGALPPTESILGAVSHIRPKGADTGRWCEALLDWAEAGPSRVVATRLLADVVDNEPLPLEPSTRASLFTEVIRLLLDLGLFTDALAALSGPTAVSLAEAGAARVLTEAWVQLPQSRRPEAALSELVTMVIASPDGDEVVSHLWQALMVEERDNRADFVLREVCLRASMDNTVNLDALLAVLADSPQAMRWVGHAARIAPPHLLWSLVAPVCSGPNDPLWEHCVDVRSQHAAPEDRIADLVALPQSQIKRLERELRRAAANVRVWRFPDESVAEGAARLADLPDRSQLWIWLHLCAAPPAATADGLMAAIVGAFCTRPPSNTEERRAAAAMAEALGAADGWSPLLHAELLLRLSLAPDGDGSGFAHDLSSSIARGMGRRSDNARHFAAVTDQLGGLPPEHPALAGFLNRLLPLAFPRGVPPDYINAVDSTRWTTPTVEAWRRVVESLGQRS